MESGEGAELWNCGGSCRAIIQIFLCFIAVDGRWMDGSLTFFNNDYYYVIATLDFVHSFSSELR